MPPYYGQSAYGEKLCLELHRGSIVSGKVQSERESSSAGASSQEYTEPESIINFVYVDDIYGKNGIIEAAGDSVKAEYNNKHKDDGVGLCKTTAGKLPYKSIYHVTIHEEPGKFRDGLHKALRLADRGGLKSIAVPALSCSTDKGKKLVDLYLQVFYEVEQQARLMCLHSILVIIPKEGDYKYHYYKLTTMGEELK